MMKKARTRFLILECHPKRINHELLSHPPVHGPADHFPLVEIECDRERQPSLTSGDIGDVGDPSAVWRGHCKLPCQNVLRDWMSMARVCRGLELPFVSGDNPVRTHQLGDSVLPAGQPSGL